MKFDLHVKISFFMALRLTLSFGILDLNFLSPSQHSAALPRCACLSHDSPHFLLLFPPRCVHTLCHISQLNPSLVADVASFTATLSGMIILPLHL